MDLKGQLILERYRVLALLGEGAMGVVYLAEDVELNRQVALKVLRKELASRPDVQQRLQNECRILARLGSHPNIVTLFDRLVYDDSVVLVMEYVSGEPLTDIISRSHRLTNDPEEAKRTVATGAGMPVMVLRPSDALEIADQCLAALEFAHSKGILHRDIKPGNVLVMRDHNDRLMAKVMDFGIGKALASGPEPAMTSMTMVSGPGPGTPAYMAPEQIDTLRFGPVGPSAEARMPALTRETSPAVTRFAYRCSRYAS
jgi:serine/threonine-protein kinase